MFRFRKIENERKRLKKTFEKNVNIKRYKVHWNLIYEMKESYSIMFGEELEKIEKERNRLKLEIECIKSPIMNHVMTISSVIIGFLIKAVYDSLLYVTENIYSTTILSMSYILIIIVLYNWLTVRQDRKIRCYMFCLQALDELEEEIKKNSEFESTLKRIENYM